MATSKSNIGQLPAGFVTPKRVEMLGSHDDLLACAAILCEKSMADVRKMAITLGLRANGPFKMDEVMFRKILFNLSNFAVSDYKDLTSVDALPDVAVLCVDWLEHEESSRHLIFVHHRATPQQAAFSFLIDPANWIDPKHHIGTDTSYLNLKPAWYLEITQRAGTTPTRGK